MPPQLSSTTLGLKFMQRGNANKSQATSEPAQPSIVPSPSAIALGKRRAPSPPVAAPPAAVNGKLATVSASAPAAKRVRYVTETSLLSFPLAGSSSAATPLQTGRRTYGIAEPAPAEAKDEEEAADSETEAEKESQRILANLAPSLSSAISQARRPQDKAKRQPPLSAPTPEQREAHRQREARLEAEGTERIIPVKEKASHAGKSANGFMKPGGYDAITAAEPRTVVPAEPEDGDSIKPQTLDEIRAAQKKDKKARRALRKAAAAQTAGN
ncbi:uncharacterized protein L969DRAFT_89415 [Mixia osmundae IAM 14324]|uniref:Uncharacterized protein n=1 Tax=Mixia osmundae (strain CBS 9802 / IAM 14324 / JCM 22182 / KY 12970) TaxID=764103 RepID=G7DWS2_MIXOS|nr:uncharacterized protein L969DRAFT_91196 [Mixia osmundae IAM 14324]XP_014566731.1 uncharacterized protein L969DRAFT_89415 [Mixia osmundae IAM 14324]KEI36203.1 hypothetical protein L969DRAFT_91196 [Mixia osmundae IAM 14324]KEI38171.1 hypothetical protein L969DRAFT_89415 [Mixia osmundae IAM 14324]GAA95019.1 hypothetical protein E5Q_01674 [Mixia osmundae IAM 14324]